MKRFFHAYQAHSGYVGLIDFHPEFDPSHTEEWAESRLDIARKSARKYVKVAMDTDRSYTGRFVTIFFLDEESGILTADPFHFEDWLDKLGKPF